MGKGFKLQKLSQTSYNLYATVEFLYLTFMPICVVYGLAVGSYYYQQIYWGYIILIVSLYVLARHLFIKAHKCSNQPKELYRRLALDQSQITTGFQSQQLASQQQSNDKIKVQVVFPNEQNTQKTRNRKNLTPEQIREGKNPDDRPAKLYCKQCKITVPYRARHCRDCNLCTLRFDHHCFWLGNCVGQKNHRDFYLLVWVQFFQSALSMCYGWDLFFIVQGYIVLTGYFCFAWLIFLLLFTLYLIVVNTMLIAKGTTTWQASRRKRISYLNYLNEGYNPFTKGVIQNFKSLLFATWEQQNGGQQWPIPTYGQAQFLGVKRSERL